MSVFEPITQTPLRVIFALNDYTHASLLVSLDKGDPSEIAPDGLGAAPSVVPCGEGVVYRDIARDILGIISEARENNWNKEGLFDIKTAVITYYGLDSSSTVLSLAVESKCLLYSVGVLTSSANSIIRDPLSTFEDTKSGYPLTNIIPGYLSLEEDGITIIVSDCVKDLCSSRFNYLYKEIVNSSSGPCIHFDIQPYLSWLKMKRQKELEMLSFKEGVVQMYSEGSVSLRY